MYEPPYAITNDMLRNVSQISEKVGRIDGSRLMETHPHMRHNNRIRSVHSSLKIEANSLSLEDVRGVLNGKTVVGPKKEILEVQNAFAAYKELGSFDPYSIDDLLRIHGIMTDKIVDESGIFRSGNEGVFNGDRCIFVAPPPDLVPKLMHDLFDWMKTNRDSLHALILSSVFITNSSSFIRSRTVTDAWHGFGRQRFCRNGIRSSAISQSKAESRNSRRVTMTRSTPAIIPATAPYLWSSC